jgi:hypothetical protein
MKLASTVILVERELESATQTLENILEGVSLRVDQLAESFRQQGNDPKARFMWYAHGLYNFWYSPELTTDDTKYWETHDFGLDDTELEIDSTALKLGPFSLTEDNGVVGRPVKFIAFNPGQQPEDPMEEYIRLWCLNDLHNTWNFYPNVIPPYLSLTDKERLNSLSQELPSVDVERWNLLAELQMRRRLFECQCDACHYLVSDVLHRCIDCESNDYDVCVDCESQPVSDHKYSSNHKSTHNMLVFRMSLPHGRYSRVRWYARNFLSTCMPATAPPEAPLTVRQEESQTQSDGPELLRPTEVTRADDSSTSAGLQEGDEKLNGNPGVVFEEIARTSVASGDAYVCAECGVKMKGVFYVCLTCGENNSPIALCGDCAFHDVFNAVTEHHPYKHWLIKIKDRVRDIDTGTSDESSDNVNEITSLSLRVDKLAAMVESRFVEQDLRLNALVTQIDQLVRSLAASTGQA